MNKKLITKIILTFLILGISLTISYFMYTKSTDMYLTEQLQGEIATKIILTTTAQFKLENGFATSQVEMDSTQAEFRLQETAQSQNVASTAQALQTQQEIQIQNAKATENALEVRQTQQSLDATKTASIFQTQQAEQILNTKATVGALQTQQKELEGQNSILIEKNRVRVRQLIELGQDIPVDIRPEATPTILQKNEVHIDYKFGKRQTCDRAEQTISTAPDQFTALETNLPYLWPGSVIQGRDLRMGVLSPLGLPRSAMDISLLGQNAKVEDPNRATVEAKINEILPLIPKQPQSIQHFNVEQVSSIEEITAKAGLGMYLLGNKNFGGSVNFNVDLSEKQNHVMIQYYQIYYDVSVDPVNDPVSLFLNPRANTAEKNISGDNPPLYISNVSYGRMFIIIASSSASAEYLKGAIEAQWSKDILGIAASIKANKDFITKDASYQMFFVGGTAANAADVMLYKDFEDIDPLIKKYINDETSYSKDNPGAPIFYRVNYLKNNQIARVSFSTKFVSLVNCVLESFEPANFTITIDTIEVRKTGRVGFWTGVDLSYAFEVQEFLDGIEQAKNNLKAEILRDANNNEVFYIQQPSILIPVVETNGSCLKIVGTFERIVTGEFTRPGNFEHPICFNNGYWLEDGYGTVDQPITRTRRVDVGVMVIDVTFTITLDESPTIK